MLYQWLMLYQRLVLYLWINVIIYEFMLYQWINVISVINAISMN